jgi:predicted O-methyltransferase YrrM
MDLLSTLPEVKTRADLAKVINHLGLKTGVEIGVFKGNFSEFLLGETDLSVLTGVDSWEQNEKKTRAVYKKWAMNQKKLDEAREEALAKLEKYGSRSVIVREISEVAADQFEDESLDFIYIDASHRFSGVAMDLLKWWPKLKPGGLFAGHDYWKCYRCEVMEAVNGFVVETKQILRVTTDDLNNKGDPFYPPTWWWVKEALSKSEYNARIAEASVLLKKQEAILLKGGVEIVLPYQYYNG